MDGKTADKFAVARTLRDIATLLALSGDTSFKRRAYRRAADAIEALPDDLGERVDQGRLTEIAGIGDKLARQIAEIWHTGRSSTAERLANDLPPGSVELAYVPGLTVRRIRALHAALGTRTLADIRAACEAGRVRHVPGFGPKTEQRILEGIHTHLTRKTHVRLFEAERIAADVGAFMRAAPGIDAVDTAGELRRSLEVVDEVVLVIHTGDPAMALARFASYPAFASVDAERTTGRLSSGIAVRLVIAAAGVWTLFAATGPLEHVELVERRLAPSERVGLESEAELYRRANLPSIPPELRDLPGVIEAAERGESFDDLIEDGDVRGLVHCHTVYSDGRDTILAMAEAAERRGAGYITITDHSQSAFYAGGLSVAELERQWEEIAEVQSRVGVRILRGIESDILADGSLDYPDAILEKLDVIIASVHGRMRMNEDEMTARLLRMVRLPQMKIWGHALGRILLRRPPFACRVEEVLDAAADSRCAIEVNGDPHRMDLAPGWIRVARERRIPFVLSTDAHSTRTLGYVRMSVLMARRGGLRKREVLNTLEADAFARAVRPTG